MNKRGQFQLSFGMIFSIFIIIVTLSVAFYVIKEFVVTSDCVKIRLFYEELDKKTETVWRSAASNSTFESDISTKVKSVCFGNPAQLNKQKYPTESKALSSYSATKYDVFLYPRKACGSNLAARDVEHIKVPVAFCVPVKEGNVKIHLIKEVRDSLVSVTP